jgi:hypothetical protein
MGDEKFIQYFDRRKETTWETKAQMEDNITVDLKETVCRCGLDSYISGQRPMASFCEHCDDILCFVTRGEFLD